MNLAPLHDILVAPSSVQDRISGNNVVEWQCRLCTYFNTSSPNICLICLNTREITLPNTSAKTGPDEYTQYVDSFTGLSTPQENDWECQSCTFINASSTQICRMCEIPKVVNLQKTNINSRERDANTLDLVISREDRDDEWKCEVCTFLNTSRTNKCSICAVNRGVSLLNVDINENCRQADASISDHVKLRSTYENYLELAELDGTDLITSLDHFECPICLITCSPGEGITLKECLHTFCRDCLTQFVEHSSETEIKCPFRGEDYQCHGSLQEREIKALVSREMYDKILNRSVTEAEQRIANTFHCKTVNCTGWCVLDDMVDSYAFHCPICGQATCIKCQAIHPKVNCEDYRLSINPDASETASAARLKEMLDTKEAMRCPSCQIMITKTTGCNHMTCSVCKTPICWGCRGLREPNGCACTNGQFGAMRPNRALFHSSTGVPYFGHRAPRRRNHRTPPY